MLHVLHLIQCWNSGLCLGSDSDSTEKLAERRLKEMVKYFGNFNRAYGCGYILHKNLEQFTKLFVFI